ncbi:hypothetical protein TrRE_jg1110 [Triparma retinervis]|uniref:Aminotransferase class I/classII large domain-containing protein n=1 Tax=Triparma retinervis TaxID=2557542 RepID=A0A9W7E6M2_9STRA|nr:hypothetical protein TrRE_jg1110 [Triparma retinervis]
MWDGKSGCLNVSVAENRAVTDLVLSKLLALDGATPFTEDSIYYQDTRGMEGCRKAVARHLTKLAGTEKEVDHEKVIISAGCNAVLETLFSIICDPGDVVMVPSPYYATFKFDLGCRSGVLVSECSGIPKGDGGSPSDYYPTPEYLESTYQRILSSAGRPPKALLFTNPHNPVGIIYPPHVVAAMMDWSDSKGMHVVSDEIYGGSIFSPSSPPHVSLLAVSESKHGRVRDNHHVVYAMSKDFAASGLRVGAGVVGGGEVMEGARKVNDMCQVSSHTQLLVEGMLGDEGWVEGFRREQGRRVGVRYERVKEALGKGGVKWVEAQAGMFVWVDCRGLLREGETEEGLNERMVEHGVMMTPGGSMGMEGEGWFRCVFTAVDDEGFEVLIKRLERLGELRGEPEKGGNPLDGLIEFPARMRIKVVGPNDDGFVEDIKRAVGGVVDVEADKVGRRDKGKWTSVSFDIEVESEEVRKRIYEAIDKDERVKFKL